MYFCLRKTGFRDKRYPWTDIRDALLESPEVRCSFSASEANGLSHMRMLVCTICIAHGAVEANRMR